MSAVRSRYDLVVTRARSAHPYGLVANRLRSANPYVVDSALAVLVLFAASLRGSARTRRVW